MFDSGSLDTRCASKMLLVTLVGSCSFITIFGSCSFIIPTRERTVPSYRYNEGGRRYGVVMFLTVVTEPTHTRDAVKRRMHYNICIYVYMYCNIILRGYAAT